MDHNRHINTQHSIQGWAKVGSSDNEDDVRTQLEEPGVTEPVASHQPCEAGGQKSKEDWMINSQTPS